MTWRITVHHATGASPRCVTRPRLQLRPAQTPMPGPARSGPRGTRSPGAARSSCAADTAAGNTTPASTNTAPPDRQVPHPRRAAVLRPCHRRRRPTAGQIGRLSAQQLQLATGIRGRKDLEPRESEQGSSHRRRIVIHPGASHARVRLAVITNRGGPGTYLSSSGLRRCVGTRARESQVRCEVPD
jgi:hypothetical protein